MEQCPYCLEFHENHGEIYCSQSCHDKHQQAMNEEMKVD